MKVKMTTALATEKMNLSFGEVVLVDTKFGEQLIASNMATLVKEKEKETKPAKEVKESKPKKRGGRPKKVVE